MHLGWMGLLGLTVNLCLAWIEPAAAAIAPSSANRAGLPEQSQQSSQPIQRIRPPSTCPTTVDELLPLLLRDIPSYGNRVVQRSFNRLEADTPNTYLVIAGRPEIEPLPARSDEYTPQLEDENLHQIFFTTLERQHVQRDIKTVQVFHWLFLTRSNDTWRLALLFSQVRSGSSQPPTPPEETSQGIVGQAVTLWLRDCHAGAIRQL